MLVTIQNTSGGTINQADAITGGDQGFPWGLNAVGGNRVKGLPYPFAHIGSLANSASKQLPMHAADLRERRGCGSSFEAQALWMDLVQRGIVTFVTADQTDFRSVEDEFIAEL